MAKRVVTKIGDIFCVEIDGQYKRYFQYVANDMTQLNSSVIRAFKKKYPMDYVPDMDEIVSDEMEFYAHTILRAGIVYNTWYKVGKSNNIGDPTKFIFRDTNDIEDSVSNDWYVWYLNGPDMHVGKLPPKYYDAEIGLVKAYIDIVNRLRTGKYAYKYPAYQK